MNAVASFDIEEHHRIEAAAGLECPPTLKAEYARRMEAATLRLLEQLHRHSAKATFFVVGEIARTHPQLLRAIVEAGHEVGSHSLSHQSVRRLTPEQFRADLKQSKDVLEQAIGGPIFGYRAPTFSVVQETGWAIDVLAECGFEYDSSIFPVRHDRYGIPSAPRQPFVAVGNGRELLELPPLTYRLAGQNLPVAGGGYFRLFPLQMMRSGIRQMMRQFPDTAVAMLYFHPWEFDPEQPRLPLRRFSRWRTYVGMRKTTARLDALLGGNSFVRAIDAVRALRSSEVHLPRFRVVGN
jgi:polysaccharide deacetylase family protein (PEP-CTERM system associated)